MSDPISVVVADDHPVVRQGIVALLASAEGIDVVATAADGRAPRPRRHSTIDHR